MERIISEYLDQFNILYCMIISSIFAAGGASAEIINGASESSSLSEMIVGPLGALALAVVILYFSVKLLIKKDKKADDLYERLIKSKEKEIESLKKN
jgi:hypothetical protein|tara:strand:- start:108 stop:398 length:291 start_codon:yes stop_codon:yes gene_type:complete